MANTFVELNDTPSNYTGSGAKYLQVDGPEGNVIFNNIDLNNLADVNAPAPGGNQVLQWVSAANEWRAVTYAPYSAGNGINFGGTGYVINAVAGSGGGLTSNTSGIYITDIANVSGTYGNATYTPQLTVNSKGQITGVAEVQSSITLAESLNASYVGNVIGTSGQITVTGGTGINSNATLNLVATGVTAGIYGNATAIPKITVDSYGRISSVDVVDVVASGGSGNADLSNVTTLAYSNIHVSGQTSLGADKKDDDLTFAGGLAIDATTDANNDTISFALNPTDAAANMSISGFSDVDASGITNGQALIWNSSTSKFEAGNVSGGSGNSNVTLTDFSVTTATPSGNGSLTYDNAGVFTFTPANVQAGGGSTQSLSWESANSNLTISSGNSVDLSALSQTLSVAGNVITISGSSDTVDLTSALGNVAGNYGDSNVASYLSVNGYSNVDNDAQTLSLSANILTISGSNSSVDVGKTRFYYANQTDFPNATTYHGAIAHSHSDGAMYFAHGGSWNKLANDSDLSSYQTIVAATTANTNMQAYVDALETRIIGGANVSLDSLAEVANALANSNTELSTVAFTGAYSDVTGTPTLALSGNTYLTLDGANIDLSGVVGQTGAQGPQGNAGIDGTDGVSVTNATINTDNLVLTLSNASTIDAGNVRGPVGLTGATGPQGDGNAGIGSASIDVSGNLILTLNDSTTVDAGNVKGDTGATGPTGVGITSSALVGGNLTLTYSNTSTQDIGNIQGPQGDQGIQGNVGVGVDTATVTGSNLIITLSNASTIDAGNVEGPQGATGATGPQGPAGNVLVTTANAAPSGASEGQMWYATDDGHTYIYYNNAWVQANPGQDPQTLSLVGNVLTISGSNSNVDFTSALNVDTDAQDLTLSGNVISLTGQSGNVDLTSLLGAYINTDSQTLSVNDASNVITITGGNTIDLSNVLANASGATSLLNLTDVGSDGTNGQVLTTDGNGSFTFTTVSGGGGSGDITSVIAGVGLTGGASTGDATIDLANTAVTPGTYGSATKSARITVDQQGRITGVAESTISGGGGGGGAGIERFKLNYASNGNLAGTSDLTSGISGVTVNSATGGEVSITFDSGTYNLPPGSIMFYGYDYTNNKYSIVPFETSMGYREIDAGGSSGSPTLFNGASTLIVKLRLREAETGASRGGFGTTTHAWIQFVMSD